MTQYIPKVGDLFYVDTTPQRTEQILQGGRLSVAVAMETKARNTDAEKVFQCIAADMTAVVADVVYGSWYGSKRRLLAHSQFEYQPLGPGMAVALGIEETVSAQARTATN